MNQLVEDILLRSSFNRRSEDPGFSLGIEPLSFQAAKLPIILVHQVWQKYRISLLQLFGYAGLS